MKEAIIITCVLLGFILVLIIGIILIMYKAADPIDIESEKQKEKDTINGAINKAKAAKDIVKVEFKKILGSKSHLTVPHALENIDGTLFEKYTLIDRKGVTRIIDYIFVCRMGVFVINSINFKGKVFAQEFDEEWVFESFNESKLYKTSLLNENNKNINYLSKILEKETEYIQGLVVFINTDTSSLQCPRTVKIESLSEYISEKELCLDEPKMSQIIETLNLNNKKETLKKHHFNKHKSSLK